MQLLQSFTCILVFVSMTSAVAEPVQWLEADGGNGHWYDAVHVAGGLNWGIANTAAMSRNGYLATVTSAEENNFIFGLISNPRFWEMNVAGNDSEGPWLGGVQPDGSREPAGGWTWVTGEKFSYTAWAPRQPNNAGNRKQNRLHYWTTNNTLAPTWQDASSSTGPGGPEGYIVEFDTKPGLFGGRDDSLKHSDLMKLPKTELVRHCLDLQRHLAELELEVDAGGDPLGLKSQVASLEAENERLSQTIGQMLPREPIKPAVEPKANEVPRAAAPADKPKDEFNPEAYTYKYEILRYVRPSSHRNGYFENNPRRARHQKNQIQVRLYFKNETGVRIHAKFFIEVSRQTKSSRGENLINVLGRTIYRSEITASPGEVKYILVPVKGDHVVDANYIRLIEAQIKPY